MHVWSIFAFIHFDVGPSGPALSQPLPSSLRISSSSQPWVMQVIIISVTFFAVQVIFHTLWCAGGALVVSAVGGRPAERWLMRGLSVLTVLVVIWAVALDDLV